MENLFVNLSNSEKGLYYSRKKINFLKMKKFNFYYLFAFVAVGLFVTGCSDDDDNMDEETNIITITIEEPLNDGVVADCSDVHIHIDVSASIENHEVEVVLHPDGDVNDKIIDWDMHDHDKVITFEQEVDLCAYGPGACFHLEVEACVDHECEERSTADVEFCIQ